MRSEAKALSNACPLPPGLKLLKKPAKLTLTSKDDLIKIMPLTMVAILLSLGVFFGYSVLTNMNTRILVTIGEGVNQVTFYDDELSGSFNYLQLIGERIYFVKQVEQSDKLSSSDVVWSPYNPNPWEKHEIYTSLAGCRAWLDSKLIPNIVREIAWTLLNMNLRDAYEKVYGIASLADGVEGSDVTIKLGDVKGVYYEITRFGSGGLNEGVKLSLNTQSGWVWKRSISSGFNGIQVLWEVNETMRISAK